MWRVVCLPDMFMVSRTPTQLAPLGGSVPILSDMFPSGTFFYLNWLSTISEM